MNNIELTVWKDEDGVFCNYPCAECKKELKVPYPPHHRDITCPDGHMFKILGEVSPEEVEKINQILRQLDKDSEF
jgi:DNA-directed RNA polymerase subunit RPC12/RpoP